MIAAAQFDRYRYFFGQQSRLLVSYAASPGVLDEFESCTDAHEGEGVPRGPREPSTGRLSLAAGSARLYDASKVRVRAVAAAPAARRSRALANEADAPTARRVTGSRMEVPIYRRLAQL